MITTDSLILADEASGSGGGLAFDLGTGEGQVAGLVAESNPGFTWVGLDICVEMLLRSRASVLPVAARIEDVRRIFPSGIADLVTANPPYFVRGTGRESSDPRREQSRRGGPLLLYSFVFAAAHLLREGGVFLMTLRRGMEREVFTVLAASGMEAGKLKRYGKLTLVRTEKSPA